MGGLVNLQPQSDEEADRYRQFALRWRTEEEVISGAGETTCGNTRCPLHKEFPEQGDDVRPALTTLELPFSYLEHGESKFALVKVVLCPKCVRKLMYKRNKEKEEARRREAHAGSSSPRAGDEKPRSGSRKRRRSRDSYEDDRSYEPKESRRSKSREHSEKPEQPRRRERASRSRSPRRRKSGARNETLSP